MEDYVFGKGWDPLFGVGPDAIPRRVLYKKDKKKASRKRNAALHGSAALSQSKAKRQGMVAMVV